MNESYIKPTHTYRYEGCISIFGRCISENQTLETRASSIAKARSNFEYQCKKKLGLRAGSKIDLIGTIVQLD